MKWFRNIRFRYKAGLIAALVLFVYTKGCIHGQEEEQRKLPPIPGILKPDEVGQALINPSRHEITFVTRKGTSKHFLPDGPSKLTLKTDGSVVINIPTWGFQLRPFAGAVVSDRLKGEFGLDLIYWNKANVGLAAQGGPRNTPLTAAIHVSYLVWRNTFVGLSFDNQKSVGLTGGIRF